MPQMGVSVAEGTIVAWRKGVGDHIDADEPIVEISTDKVETEIPSPASGQVVEILVEPGQTVDVGTVLARIGVSGGGPQVSEPEPEAAQAAAAPAPAPSNGNGNGHAKPRNGAPPIS